MAYRRGPRLFRELALRDGAGLRPRRARLALCESRQALFQLRSALGESSLQLFLPALQLDELPFDFPPLFAGLIRHVAPSRCARLRAYARTPFLSSDCPGWMEVGGRNPAFS
jgi:hypothetical protein